LAIQIEVERGSLICFWDIVKKIRVTPKVLLNKYIILWSEPLLNIL